mgnify:CR=1 FL=1
MKRLVAVALLLTAVVMFSTGCPRMIAGTKSPVVGVSK